MSSSSQGKSKDQGKDRRGRKDDNRDGGRGGRGGGRGFGGGRGQWVMPTGAAFFTGNASTALASKVNSGITIPVKAETSGRIARPNEIIDDVISVKTGTSVEKKSNLNRVNNQDAEVISIGDDSAAPFVPMQVEEDTDSDASVHEDEEDNNTHNLGVEGLEVWPPKHYDSTAPLSLPFGPKTATMRKILAAQVRALLPSYSYYLV